MASSFVMINKINWKIMGNMHLNHRLAEDSEAPDIEKLLVIFFQEMAKFRTANQRQILKDPQKIYLTKLPLAGQGRNYFYFVSLLEDKKVALALVLLKEKIFQSKRPIVLIDCALTLPEYRRNGVMTGLMAYIKNFLREKNLLYFEVNVMAENREAIQFWQRLGLSTYSVNLRGSF
jgi:GNAT superfamily N-acetyltransferase